jgi:hypothetical protein
MLLGHMISRAFMPSYVPVYTQPYTTPAARTTALRTQRNSFRAANPSKFTRARPSGSGRVYKPPRSSTPRIPRGGGRFGIRIAASERTAVPARLTS